MEEVWKPYPEFPNNYLVSNLGKVKNMRGRELKPQLHKTGYLRVYLCVDSRKYVRSTHRMVAITFLETVDGKEEVNHLDLDKTNNVATNLQWATKQENMDHAVLTKAIQNPFGVEARNSKYRTKIYDLEGNLKHVTYGNKELKDLGFDWRNVHACITGRQKTHRGHRFTREVITDK